MAKKKHDDEFEEEIEPTADGDGASQLDRIEYKLDQLLEHLKVEEKDDQARNVPYVAPEMPRGLSPNQIINHPIVREPSQAIRLRRKLPSEIRA